MASFKVRLARLEEVAAKIHPTTRLVMSDGSVMQVPADTGIECLCELLAAGGEGREPSHRYLDAVVRAEDSDDPLCSLVKALYQDFEEDGLTLSVAGGGEHHAEL